MGVDHGLPDSLVHNTFDYRFDAPGLTFDSYLAQPSAQFSSYNVAEPQGLNLRTNQLGNSMPVMDNRPTSLSVSFGSQHNSQHDITRADQVAHAFGTPSGSQTTSVMIPISLTSISNFQHDAPRPPDTSVLRRMTGHQVTFVSDHQQYLPPHFQPPYSQGDCTASYELQDGYLSLKQSSRWPQTELVPANNDAVPLERYYIGRPSQFQQPRHCESPAPTSTSNAPLYAPQHVSPSASASFAYKT